MKDGKDEAILNETFSAIIDLLQERKLKVSQILYILEATKFAIMTEIVKEEEK